MECLDANVVQDLMAGALSASAKTSAIQHLDGCDDCRDLLGALARDATRDAALDTLNDTEKNPRNLSPNLSIAETIGSDASALMRTADPLEATGYATDYPDPATKPIRIRPASAVAGTTLGRYTLLERLGAGAMGVVFRATDRELGRDVALKQLHRPDEALTDRLVREARAMAQVNHPNVVAVYDVGTAEGVTYIAMEMVSGDSLRAWQRESRTVPEIVEAYVGAGRGLAAAHAAGIVHRDFKPDNVLVGRDERVRVTDFGLAAARTSEPGERAPVSTLMSDVNLTTSGSVLGTPAYMAPEQFAGGNVDARTDQFNFSVALYEALYGQRPFEGKTFPELCDNVTEGRVRPAPPGTRISRGLRAILLRGLSVKPGDRYPTMEHMLVELGRDRARPWRRTSIVATALAAVLALGLGADWAVRDRVSLEIRQSFAATAKQSDRAVTLIAEQFDAISNLVYLFPIMRDVAAHHDQADFGLGEATADAEELAKLHDQLKSADWTLARRFGGREHPSILAVADYKARLLFTSAAPDTWRTDLATLPWIKQALDAGTGNSMTLMRYDEPSLVATGILGTEPRTGLAMLFTRTLSLGEARSQFLQIVDAGQLLDQIRLDDDTLLSLVASDGSPAGDVPAAVVAGAPAAGQSSITVDGTTYEVQALPLTGFAGRLVMARPMSSVLALFPNARVVFLIALFAALATALGTALRARRITGARVA